jgi:hypothetical protein
MEGEGGGRRKGWPVPVFVEMSLSEAFLRKAGDGFMVEGEESMEELGESFTCSGVGDSGSRV